MGRVMASWFVLLALATTRAAAEPQEEWKDGCPAFFPPEAPPPSLSDLPTHTGVASFGALPELDSPLGPSRIALGSWASQLSEERPAVTTEGLESAQALIHLAATSGPFVTVSLAAVRSFDPHPAYTRWGNFQGFLGYRHAKYLLGTALRLAGAIRLGEGGNDAAGGDVAGVMKRREIAELSAFRESLFGFERPLSATLETRIEMVGCHAPFVDLRVDATTWRPSDNAMTAYPRVFVLPIALAFGGYFLPRHALFAEFAWEYRWNLAYSHLTRVSIGWEWRPSWIDGAHVGVTAGAISGDNAGGWQLMAMLAWQFGWKGRLE